MYIVYVCIVQSASPPEEANAMATTDTATDDDELQEKPDSNAYPMITLSVDSETEAEAARGQHPPSPEFIVSELCSP